MANQSIYWKKNICSKCKVRQRKAGASWCDICNKIIHREYYQKNRESYIRRTTDFIKKHRETYKEYQRKGNFRLRVRVMEFFSDGEPRCMCCGEKEIKFLQIDHINGGGSKERRDVKKKGGSEFYRWLLLQKKDLTRYQVLCMNCNRAKYEFKICPHQEK